MLLKEGKRLLSEIEPGFDPEPIHLRCRRRPNAVEFFDRQILDKGGPHLWGDDEETIGLAMIRGEFGEEFVVGNARGGWQAGLSADLRPDLLCNLRRRRNPFQIFGDVEIGLVEREAR